ncbi:hypothetical protein KOW79_018581 [Hemibagrus wyckioides]|uniref:Uncharacterized protein n=1 Tax=Hemibagrus wyckioides TaxID=337641 RepID=A0A9D3N6F0_9TELE|nr:hypothetical protein KOW79_018581 [Hemibagrus wyckioides]
MSDDDIRAWRSGVNIWMEGISSASRVRADQPSGTVILVTSEQSGAYGPLTPYGHGTQATSKGSSRSKALPKRLTYFPGCRRGGGEGAALLDTRLLRHIGKIDGFPSSCRSSAWSWKDFLLHAASREARQGEVMRRVQLEVCQRQEEKMRY